MKSIALFSGGLDSTVMVAQAMAERNDLECLVFDYGQRNIREIHSLNVLLSHVLLGLHDKNYVNIRIPDIHVVRIQGFNELTSSKCALLNYAAKIPNADVHDPVQLATYVANRNMIFLSFAIARLITAQADNILYGAQSGGHEFYPDTREYFVIAMNQAMKSSLPDDFQRKRLRPRIVAPFLNITKADVIRIGKMLGVPLQMTYSCYNGTVTQCGICKACVTRKQAFADACVQDPTVYSVA